MKELEEKIQKILLEALYKDTNCWVETVTEIAALIEPIQHQLDKQIKGNNVLLAINREFQEKIENYDKQNDKYKKLIESQDELIKSFDKYGGDGFWNIKLRTKIEQLKKELK